MKSGTVHNVHKKAPGFMPNRDILAIGASAGGVEALLSLTRRLPQDFPAAILITLHMSSEHGSVLDDILNRAGRLHACFPKDGDHPRKGHIYIAPPDRHLLLIENQFTLGTGSRENNARPAIDPMMRSVAACCGPRAIGVVLTGTLSDGASGLWAIDQCGGMTVVQDPNDALFPDMPINALNRVPADHVATLAAMPQLLQSLVLQPAGETMPIPQSIGFEIEIARGRRHATVDDMDKHGKRSMLACPDCHGVMWEIYEGELTRFRCHVGHTYAAEGMSVALDENLRRALGIALRALEERRALARRLEAEAETHRHPQLAASWGKRAREYEAELKVIRDSVDRMDELARAAPQPAAAE